ncbi:MAG: hypothetical protein SPJ13_05995 [Bacteroidales bacterium]|nr:hypothetical protein [Bacteroidales bacterium]
MKKRTVILFMLATLAWSLTAQDVVYTHGKVSSMGRQSRKDPSPTLLAQRGYSYYIYKVGSGVLKVDGNLKIQAQCKLEADDLQAFSVVDDRAYLIIGDDTRKKCYLQRIVVDLNSMQMVESDVVMNKNFARRDKFYFWIRQSKNRKYTAVFTALDDKDAENKAPEVRLYDSTLHEISKYDIDVNLLSDFFVTDDGEIAMAGFHSEGGSSLMEIHVVERELGDMHYRLDMDTVSLLNLDIVNVSPGHVLMGGVEEEPIEGKTTRIGKQISKSKVNNLLFISFDRVDERVERLNKVTLTQTEKNILKNNKISKESKFSLDALGIIDKCPTNEGGVVSFQYRQHIEVYNTSNGSSTDYYSSFGSVTLCVDTLANVLWRKGIRNNIQLKNDGRSLLCLVPLRNGGVALLQNETKGAAAAVSETPMKMGKLNKQQLAVYRFNANGETEKSVLNTLKQQVILPEYVCGENGELLFLSGGYKGKNFMINSLKID